MITQAFLLGIFLSIFVYQLLMCFINPGKALWFYCLYALSLICCLYFHPANALFHSVFPYSSARDAGAQLIQIISGAGIVIFYILFCIHLVHHNNWKPGIKKLLYILGYAFAADLILALLQVAVWGFEPPSPEPFLLTFIRKIRLLFFWTAVALLVYSVLIHYIFSKDRLVRFLGLSSLFLIVGGSVFALSDQKVYLFSDPANNYRFFQVMCILQLMSFAFLLSYQGRRMEKEKAQLELVDAAKSRFFANVSHEFRTPLTLILGPVSDLLKKDRDQRERQYLRLIRKNTLRLLRLVNQILDLAKLDSGSLALKPEPGDLVHFCRQMVLSFSSLAENRNIDLSFESRAGEIRLLFDRDNLEKIISNLLSNALKHTPENGIVRLILQLDKGKGQVLIRVADSGSGIPEALLSRIFDRFYQADTSNFTSDLPSTGIGLALTRELVELHGGKIEVESSPGRGSTFTVSIPYQEAPQLPVTPETSSAPGISPDTASVPAQPEERNRQVVKPLILVIEDNEDVMVYIRTILREDFQVITAGDGEAGVKTAIAEIPDLIITDVMMPKKDGFAVTQELKANEMTSHIPIIILTGKSSRASKLQGLETDADDYLTKPFDSAELDIRIRNLLRNRQRLQMHYSRNAFLKSGREQLLSREELFLQKVTAIIDENLGNEDLQVENLSRALFLDRTQLYRKIRALTGKSPSRFIRSYRLQHARQLLEADAFTASEIAFSVGFRDVAYFSRCFKEEFGYPPSHARLHK